MFRVRMRGMLAGVLMLVCMMVAAPAQAERVVSDGLGRQVAVPDSVDRVICSGSGCLRLLTYLQAQDRAVAVDDIEGRRSQFDARPYALANPRFKSLPVFGEFRGFDHPEQILTLDPQPQVIFKISASTGHDPVELQAKTAIPVVVLDYGDLDRLRPQLYASLRTMGEVLGRQERAEEVVRFLDGEIADLGARVADITEQGRPTAYVGGVAHRGAHGFQSTEPAYPPFAFIPVVNLAAKSGDGKQQSHADVAKEQIVAWDPDWLFLDLATLQLGDEAGGLYELRHDPAYQSLTAVQGGRVYGVLPYNWYSQNFGSILADAWYVGALIYPERFADVDPAAKADAIYTFLVGKPVFAEMNAAFQGLIFQPAPVR